VENSSVKINVVFVFCMAALFAVEPRNNMVEKMTDTGGNE
jgi:hypothetical protein